MTGVDVPPITDDERRELAECNESAPYADEGFSFALEHYAPDLAVTVLARAAIAETDLTKVDLAWLYCHGLARVNTLIRERDEATEAFQRCEAARLDREVTIADRDAQLADAIRRRDLVLALCARTPDVELDTLPQRIRETYQVTGPALAAEAAARHPVLDEVAAEGGPHHPGPALARLTPGPLLRSPLAAIAAGSDPAAETWLPADALGGWAHAAGKPGPDTCGAHSGRYPNPAGVHCTLPPHGPDQLHAADRDNHRWTWGEIAPGRWRLTGRALFDADGNPIVHQDQDDEDDEL